MVSTIRRIAFACFVAASLSACASSHMVQVAQPKALEARAPDEALVVFLRTSSFGGAVQSPFDLEE
jgi:hypothetical protein